MNWEDPIKDVLGQENVMVTARGTSALWLALKVIGPKRLGVIVPANVCEVVVAAIYYAGLQPVYVDVDPIIGNTDVRFLEKVSPSSAGVLIAVHNFGTPLDMEVIGEWARSREILVIEDACNALGARVNGCPIGVFGDAAIYSFGRGKIVDVGCGGVLAARDPALIRECRRLEATLDVWGEAQQRRDSAFQAGLRVLRQHQELKDPVIYQAYFQRYRPALVARAASASPEVIGKSLGGLPANMRVRRERAERYRKTLAHPMIIHRPPSAGEVPWRYVCHLPSMVRDKAVNYLRQHNVPVSTFYPAVDRLFAERPEGLSLQGADRFERSVVNLWLEPGCPEDVVESSSSRLLECLTQADRGQ